jgi:hypothetical protein
VNPPLRKIQVKVPESCLGQALGELSRIGGTITGLSGPLPIHTIFAEVPSDEVLAFEVWLADVSRGEGRVYGVESANDEDG